jgi:hypothetical protein
MTISTHTRVERGYYRRYYAANADEIRPKARVRRKWDYLHGCALQLLEELREHWRQELEQEQRALLPPRKKIRSTRLSLATYREWMDCATDGVDKPSTGRSVLRIRSTG